MKAIIVEKPGGPENLKFLEMPDPVAGEGEVLVAVEAAGVNRADVLQREGRYPVPPGSSPVLGLEVAGRTVQAIHGWPKGSRVMALVPGGGYASMAAVPVGALMAIPQNLSFEQAAAAPEAFLTAFHNLFDLGTLQAGETVLIHAASSGVGSAAVQIAHLAGARVIATSRSADKLNRVQELGADVVICTANNGFAEKVEAETGGKGVQVILDFIGAAYWKENIRSLARGGRMALIGTLGGSRAEVDLGMLLQKRLRIQGSTLRGQTPEEKAGLVTRASPMILPGLEDGTLRPIIEKVFPLDQAAEAHRLMESGQHFGKIVLRIED